MTDRLPTVDRLWVLLLGLVLLGSGLVLLDREYAVVGRYPDTVDLGPTVEVLESPWGPWLVAVVGVLLGLLALRGLLRRVGRPPATTRRLGASGPTGRLEVDLRSVADSVADRLGTQAPVTGAGGSVRRLGGRDVLLVDAHVTEDADPQVLTAAVAAAHDEVAAAFPDDDVTVRVVLEAPQRARRDRTDRVRLDG